MQSFFSERIILIIVIALVGILLFLFFFLEKKTPLTDKLVIKTESLNKTSSIIGESVERRKIEEYTYGDGKTHLLFVGGIHGGYEWNTVILAYRFMDYFEANPNLIPKNLTVTIIPSANPDGLYKIVGKEGRLTTDDVPKGSTASGRFNANEVDLNRNFDCKWQPKSTWKNNVVSAGTEAFSEPEARAIRDFVLKNNPKAVIFWHSQANTVYASKCEGGIIPETLKIMNLYAKASGYNAESSFNAYETTGDAEGWLAKIGIPAITVELETHQTIDWAENLAGLRALFGYYGAR